MDDWLTIALAAGLTARLTRLITLDTITQPIRNRLSGLLAALAECACCTGVWAAVPVGLSWHWWADQTWWQVTAMIATIAWIAGAVANAAMPSQHEVTTVGPVALVNADEPVVERVETHTETLSSQIELSEADIDRIVDALDGRRTGERPDGSD